MRSRRFRVVSDVLDDDGMTITLVCQAELHFTEIGGGRQLFASVRPERIVVESESVRRDIPVPDPVRGDVAAAGNGA